LLLFESPLTFFSFLTARTRNSNLSFRFSYYGNLSSYFNFKFLYANVSILCLEFFCFNILCCMKKLCELVSYSMWFENLSCT
jgi:hypothetical protein